MKPILLLFLFVAIGCVSQFSPKYDKNAPLLLKEITTSIQEQHLQPKTIDDQLSKEVYGYYLTEIDPNKEFLTQKDIAKLKSYENQIDEELTNGTFDFLNQALKQVEKGILKVEKYSQLAINSELDFDSNEQLETSPEKLTFASNDQALKERWHKKVKYMVLQQLWVKSKLSDVIAFEEQKEEAINQVKRLLVSKFQKIKASSQEERLQQYLNAYLKVHDVQTEYLSKAQKEKWDEDFNRTLVGIGARLEIINEYPQITELVIGGPAWKSEQIEKGDVILEVRQENQNRIDVLGMSIKEVVALLRGEKGSTVFLTLQKANAAIEEIPIVRNKVDLDPAMAFLLEDEGQKRKVGYIRLPRFYIGEQGSAAHILAHLRKFNANEVEGIVFDVRNNKGGSSREAIEMMGYFLEGGVVMQGKYQDGTHRTMEDTDNKAQYKGQLLVMTNSHSGSASELFAGTMQDYGRAVIVGSRATFGKGTIQHFVGLEAETEECIQQFGEIKMTVGKFFTASGRSPQYTGIQPDIVLPDSDAFVESGERVFEYALPHGNLEITKVNPFFNPPLNIENLKTHHLQRFAQNERLQWATKKAQQIKNQQGQTLVSLNYETFKAEQEKATTFKTLKETFGNIEGFKVSPLPSPSLAQDSTSILQNQRWIEALERDPYVEECFWIMNDMLG
ncbi:MAG: carboxy terminal-processing peptidase [Chitinophagales bacterium]